MNRVLNVVCFCFKVKKAIDMNWLDQEIGGIEIYGELWQRILKNYCLIFFYFLFVNLNIFMIMKINYINILQNI